jgi:hypothetical protein
MNCASISGASRTLSSGPSTPAGIGELKTTCLATISDLAEINIDMLLDASSAAAPALPSLTVCIL